MAGFPVKSYARGEVICKEGDQADAAYFIKEGSVDIVITRDNKQIKLANLVAGAYFGEMELILKDKKRLATVVAAENLKVAVIDEKHFSDCIGRSPAIIISLLNALSDRLWNTTSMLASDREIFMDVCEMLNLLAYHSGGDVAAEATLPVLSKAFRVDPKNIEDVLEVLETMNFVERLVRTDGLKVIRLLGRPEDFIPKVMKITTLFRKEQK
ncbi:MAG TPA: hypothetical protein DD435_15495 [Cyanobacteria bacterium UBA8530]|nr:hypothetical protein [Cyanobacteria bacterium UBA8530]